MYVDDNVLITADNKNDFRNLLKIENLKKTSIQ